MGYMGTKAFQRVNPVTDHQAVIESDSDYTWGAGEDPTKSMELNLWTDPEAAASVVAWGLDLTLIPLNVASADPFGVDGHQTSMWDQCQRERNVVDTLKAIHPQSSGAQKFHEIVLKHKQCVQWGEGDDDFGSTGGMLDMDVIAATYIWRPRLFDLAPRVLLAVDSTNGRLLQLCIRADGYMTSCSALAAWWPAVILAFRIATWQLQGQLLLMEWGRGQARVLQPWCTGPRASSLSPAAAYRLNANA